jgi:electron transfer flavoprotein alpha/beta subunit
MPLLQQVTGFAFRDGRISVCHTAFGQTVEETVDLPLILVIGDVPGTLLRVPTLRQRKEASSKEITVIAPEELPAPRITCAGMAPVDSSRQGVRIEGKDAAETAKILYDNYLREVMEVRR